MARSAAVLPLEETLLKTLDLSGDEAEEERFTVDLAWKHTGSRPSVILRSYVDQKDIEPCDIKEKQYASHTVKILGKTSVSLFLGKGKSSQEIVHSFLVGEVDKKGSSILAMDFLTNFQCVINIDSQLRLTMSKTPRERPQRYIKPYLTFDVTAGKGKATPLTFIIDTGGCTNFPLQYIEKQGLKTKKKASSGLYQYYDVEGILKIDYGGFCRSMKNPKASTENRGSLAKKQLMNTVINIKDWTMTFKSGKGDITLPFLKY